MSRLIARSSVALLAAIGLAACGAPPPSAAISPTASAAPTTTPAPTVVPTALPTPTVAPSATPAPTPTPAPLPPAGFAYRNFSGGSTSAGSAVTDVRVGSHDGYDRFVIEFAGTIPGYSITRQSTSFEASPSSQPFTLEGDTGVLIRVQPVADWTSYRSPTAFQPKFPYLRQARMAENFEAVQQWALGVDGKASLRVYELSSPSRLVVDVSG